MLRNDLYKPWFTGKENEWGFEIISGEFQGVILQLQNIDLLDEKVEENMVVDYHVIYKPSVLTDEDMNSELFKSQFTLIMTDIIKEAIEAYESEIADVENRNNNTEEPNSQ